MSPSNYNVGQVERLRREGKTWQQICLYYNVQYPAAMRWYKRQLSKLKKKGEKVVEQREIMSTPSSVKIHEKPPTGYISPLSDTEWCNKYAQHYWDTEYLTELSDFLMRRDKAFAFLPRGHGKTLRIIGLFARTLLETNTTILCITGGPANQRRIWNAVRRICTSKLAFNDYGNRFSSWNGTTKEAEFTESILTTGIDAAFSVVTRMGEIVGRHPNWIHLEDIIQEPFKSHESNVFLQLWFSGIVEFCATHEEGAKTRITGTGTRKSLNDFYAYIIEELRYKTLVKEATVLVEGSYPSIAEIYEDEETGEDRIKIGDCKITTLGCPAWPLEKLLIFRVLSPQRYEAEMQNHPVPDTGTYFDPSDMQFYQEYPPPHQCRVSIHADPSFGRKAGSDFTAIVVIAWHIPMDRFYVLEHFFKISMTYNDIIDQITQTFIKWSNLSFPIQSITVESNLYQMWLIDGFKGIPIPVEGIDNQKNKIERICTLNPILRRNMLFFNENLPGFRQMLAQLTQFDQTPSTATKKDDGLDAMQTAIQQLQIVVHTSKKSWAQI